MSKDDNGYTVRAVERYVMRGLDGEIFDPIVSTYEIDSGNRLFDRIAKFVYKEEKLKKSTLDVFNYLFEEEKDECR